MGNVLQAASNSFERLRVPQSAARRNLSTSALTVAKRSREETSDGLDGQGASRPPSVDSEAVPRVEQASPERPLRASSSTIRPGGWCALPARSTVSWSTWWTSGAELLCDVYACVYVSMCVDVEHA